MTKATPALVLALASALLLSAIVPAAVYVGIDFASLWGHPSSDHWELYRASSGGPLVLVVALAHALLIGLPLALALRHRRRLTIFLCLLYGFLIGFVPWFLLGQFSNLLGSASIDGRDLSVNGILTLYGIWSGTLFAASMGCLGALGGLAFWGLLRLCGVASSGDFVGSWVRIGACTVVVGAIAVPLWQLPDYFEIRSCHNLFRNGRTQINPVATLNVNLPEKDWPRLRGVFAQIADHHRMSFWDDSSGSPGADIMMLSLCNEEGTNVEVNEQRWANLVESYSGVYIMLYRMAPDARFSGIARDFMQSLAANWPGKISIQSSEGKLVSPAEYLGQEKNPDTEFLRVLVK